MIYDASGTPLHRTPGYTGGLEREPQGKPARVDAISSKQVPRPVLRRRVREGIPRMEGRSR
jgi:hypothetical protein